MNYRIAQLFAPKDMGAAHTEVIDLNITDHISRIQVCFRAKNASGSAMIEHPAALLPKIELVDGSEVLYSLSGKEGQALNFYNRKISPYVYIDDHANHWNSVAVSIDFGRFLYDTDLALDPKKFGNLQLKISHSEGLCSTSAGDNYLEVYAFLFDQKAITPVGFLTAKEIKSYTVGNGTYEYIDIPVDQILRGLFVNTIKNEYTWTTHIAEVRLSEDSDKRIPIDMDCNRLLYQVLEKYGYVYDHLYLDGIGSNTDAFVMGTDLGHGALSSYGANQDADIWTVDGQKVAFIMASTSYSAKGIFFSVLPHGSMPILYHSDDLIEDWYNVPALGSLQLRVKGGSSVADSTTAEIVIQQLKKY